MSTIDQRLKVLGLAELLFNIPVEVEGEVELLPR